MAEVEDNLELSSAELSGIKNALREAVTDLRFSDEALRDQMARRLLTVLGELANSPARSEPLMLLEAGPSHLYVRHASGPNGNYVLTLSTDIVDVLRNSIEHVLSSLLDFEMPIRIRLTQAGLTRLYDKFSALSDNG